MIEEMNILSCIDHACMSTPLAQLCQGCLFIIKEMNKKKKEERRERRERREGRREEERVRG